MQRQTPVRALEVETPLLPALPGAHHCGTLPTLLLWPPKGKKLSSFWSLVHLQHQLASDLPVLLFSFLLVPISTHILLWGEQLWVLAKADLPQDGCGLEQVRASLPYDAFSRTDKSFFTQILKWSAVFWYWSLRDKQGLSTLILLKWVSVLNIFICWVTNVPQ